MQKINQAPVINPESGFKNDSIKAALKLLEKTSSTHNNQSAKWEDIQSLFETSFEIYNPAGTSKITSKTLQQALWRIINKLKPLDWSLHGSGKADYLEKLVTEGVSTAMAEGGYHRCLSDKSGAFYKMALFGDAFIQIGTQDKKTGFPVQFHVCSLSDAYFDDKSIDIRDAVGGNSANDACLIFRYNRDQLSCFFPEKINKIASGKIPRDQGNSQLERKQRQENNLDTEVAYYYNIAHKRYTAFAGAECTELFDLGGDNYPFTMKQDEPYIPIIHYKFFPSSRGLYNYGLGHMLYDICVVLRRMDNMAFNHSEDNIFPLPIVNVPDGESSKFFNKVLAAHRQRAAGGKGYIVNEYNVNNPNARTSIESLQSPPLTNEWERAFTRLEQQITRMGIQLDSIDRGQSVTATQILAEEENADSFVKQIMEWNASESQFAVDATMSIIEKTVDSGDQTPINTTVDITTPDGTPLTPDNITLGMVADELRQGNYFSRINSRSGAIPSNIMQQTQVIRGLNMVQPGSPAYYKLATKFLQLNDQNIREEDLMTQGEGGAVQGDMESLEPSVMTDTSEVQARKAGATEEGVIPV